MSSTQFHIKICIDNIVMVDADPMVGLKGEYNKSGLNSAVVKMK